MKQKFSQLDSVINAIKKVSEEQTILHNNGTYGMSFKGYIYKDDTLITPEVLQLEKEIVVAKLRNNQIEMEALEKKRAELPLAQKMFIIRLDNPIPVLNGTKIIKYGGKSGFKTMHNVIEVSLRQTLLDKLSVEEIPGQMREDSTGSLVPMYNFTLDKLMIDVYYGKARSGKFLGSPDRAILTDISFQSMQLAYSLVKSRDEEEIDLEGFNEL